MKSRSVILLAGLAGLLILIVAADRVDSSGPGVGVEPGLLSLAPPVIAIVMAFVLRSVLPALLLGLWAGIWVLRGLNLEGLFPSLLSVFDEYVLAAIIDPEHAAVILFIMMIGGMIGILASNGGMLAVVDAIQRVAQTRRAGQVMITGLGLGIFFDDYANTLLVGKTMRPLADRLRISRQKLAYIVDTTASPVAGLAIISTWIGYEVGMIAANQPAAVGQSAYSIFLASLPYCFYPILTLLFLLSVGASGRDFGPMYRAESEANTAESPQSTVQEAGMDDAELLEAPAGAPRRLINFLLPVAVLVTSLVAGLAATGEGETIRQVIGSSDPYKALLWASFLGALTAGFMTVAQRILTLGKTIDSWYSGMRNTLYAIIILVLAWGLSAVTQELHAGEYLVATFGSDLSPQLLPGLTFILAALVSFAIGSCFGTIGIIMPIVLPLTWGVLGQNSMTSPHELHPIFLGVVASVLAGSIWGDHTSPISDTTILSSMSSSCDHLEHVRTQMPYGLAVGAVALLVGIMPVAYGVPVWIGLAASAAVVVGLPYLVGRKVDDGPRDRGSRIEISEQ